MNRKAIEKTELNKILSLVAEYAVLDGSRERLKSLSPETDLSAAKKSLELTEECVKLLFTFGAFLRRAFKRLQPSPCGAYRPFGHCRGDGRGD